MSQVACGRIVRRSAILKKFFLICTLATVVALAVTAGHALLTITRTINGTVVDQSGAIIPGAKIAVTQTDTKTVAQQTVSNSSGDFVETLAISGDRSLTHATGFSFRLASHVNREVAIRGVD
ncbi:MAG TPA: carboxypeptidase-like regulatory domain-containing protein [Terracidiphilus sp.]|nr:carboxypeptidase-like regulatory domain-containing protein [Terracidiphilus sp.]